MPRTEVSRVYGEPRVNENGEYLLYVCEARELVIGNAFFKKKNIQKYT